MGWQKGPPLARARLHETEALLDSSHFTHKGLLLALLRRRSRGARRCLGRIWALRCLVPHLVAVVAADGRHCRARLLALTLSYLLGGQLPLGMALGARCTNQQTPHRC